MPTFNVATKAFIAQSENFVLVADDSGQLWLVHLDPVKPTAQRVTVEVDAQST